MNVRTFTVAALLLLVAASSYAQLNTWVAQNPPNSSGSFRAVQMVSSTTSFIVGDFSNFDKTTDGGITWKSTHILGSSDMLHGLSFIDSLYGMVVGDGGAYKTTDGGTTWKLLNTGATEALNCVLLINANIGFVCGDLGTLLITHDGGATWKKYTSEIFSFDVLSIRMLRPDFIALVGVNGSIYITRDTAQSFTSIGPIYSNTINDISFADENHALAVSIGGIIFGTSNGGKTWDEVDTSEHDLGSYLHSIDSKNSSSIITGDLGRIFYTLDGGATWTLQFLGVSSSIYAVSMLNPQTAIACGADGVIVKTTDGGVTWEFLPRKPQTSLLRTIYMYPNLSTGIAAGSNAAILRSVDSGNTWLPISVDSFTFSFNGSAYFGAKGVLVGDYGTIYGTTDSGATWTRRQCPTSKTLRTVTFPTPNAVYVFGDSGAFLKSIDGGNYWVKYPSPVPDSLGITSCSFADSLTGLITESGSVYKTTNGGIAWRSVLPTPTPALSYSITSLSIGISHHNVFASGTIFNGALSPAIIYSSDEGETWSLTSTPATRISTAVFTIDGVHATSVSTNGYILHTISHDSAWNVQPTPTSSNLFGVSFGSIKAGYACGSRGTILRIDTDEIDGVSDVLSPLPANADALKIELIYPNPASNRAELSFHLPVSGQASAAIFDELGKKIISFDFGYLSPGDHSSELSLPSTASGSYTLMLTCGSSFVTGHLNIEH